MAFCVDYPLITGIFQTQSALNSFAGLVRKDVRDGVTSIKVIFDLEVKCNMAARKI